MIQLCQFEEDGRSVPWQGEERQEDGFREPYGIFIPCVLSLEGGTNPFMRRYTTTLP
jgi:hypothetical protein